MPNPKSPSKNPSAQTSDPKKSAGMKIQISENDDGVATKPDVVNKKTKSAKPEIVKPKTATPANVQKPAKSKSETTNQKSADKKPKATSVTKPNATKKSHPKLADIKLAQKTASAQQKPSASPQKTQKTQPTKATKISKAQKTARSFTDVKPSKNHKPSIKSTQKSNPKTPAKPAANQKHPNIPADKLKQLTALVKSHLADLQRETILRVAGVVLSSLLITTSLILGAMILKLNFLPNAYLLPALFLLALVAIIPSFIMLRKKVKPAVKIPLFCLAVILSSLYLFGMTYLGKTFEFLDNLDGETYMTESYYVVVEKDSAYKELDDLYGRTIATYDENADIYREALNELRANAKSSLTTVDSIDALADDLLKHKTDAILISAIHQGILDDSTKDGEEPFSAKTRIIFTIEVRVDVADLAADAVDIATKPFTIYISGLDASSDMFGIQRGLSDVNMLVTINPVTHEVLLTSIPRDFYVQFHGTTGGRDKLTHAGMFGIQMSAQTIEDLLDININYYLKVNFTTIIGLVDAIDGIEVYSDKSFVPWTNGKLYIPEGNNHMDGAMALAFARERMTYSTGDRHRIQNQQTVISAIIKKISSSTIILTRYSAILDNLASSIATNIGQDEISTLVKLQLESMPSWKIGQYRLNGFDASGVTEFMGSKQVRYVMEPDPATIQTAHDNITKLIDGQPLSSLTLTEE